MAARSLSELFNQKPLWSLRTILKDRSEGTEQPRMQEHRQIVLNELNNDDVDSRPIITVPLITNHSNSSLPTSSSSSSLPALVGELRSS